MTVKINPNSAKICIGVVSRNRRKMVGNLLESIANLQKTDEFTIEFVLVENGPKIALRELADDFKIRNPSIHLHYIHEPDIGVVNARNAALNFAKTGDFAKLAFVDDDEIVSPSWLVNLHNAQAAQKLDLVGGPVRPFIRARPTSLFKQILWKSYQHRARRVERVSNTRHAKGRSADITLATNNWMLDLTGEKNRTIQFNPRYNLTGGEDTAFFHDLKNAGGKTGWATDAIVAEEIPLARLTVRYQFIRSRDQSLVSFYRKYEHKPVKRWLTVPFGMVYKFLATAVLVLMIPFTLGNTLLSAIRTFGTVVGRFEGLIGRKTQHYRYTTGC